MILAAGRGERMRPLTDRVPKPLLPAGGRPLVEWQVLRLARAGFSELVINHAHLGAQIEAALGDGAHLGVRIRYSPEAVALETAGGIATALPLLGEAPFAVVNGDVYCEYDFAGLARAVRALENDDGRDAHLVMVDNPDHNPGGDFGLQAGRLGEAGPRLTFGGLGAYRSALFDGIAPGTRAALAPLLRAAMARGRVSGEHFRGYWLDVGTPQRLAELDERLRGPSRPTL